MANLNALDRLLTTLPWEGERTVISLSADDEGCDERTVLRVTRDEQRLGHVTLEADDDALTVWSLVIEPEYRSYGAGSETAHRLRDEAEAAGFAVLRAVAAPDLGLSVYFWTRMGLHPLHGEGPNGGLWFERRLG